MSPTSMIMTMKPGPRSTLRCFECSAAVELDAAAPVDVDSGVCEKVTRTGVDACPSEEVVVSRLWTWQA